MSGVTARETRTQAIGGALLQRARQYRAGLFSSRFWSDKLVDWAMRDPAFKLQLFRFIDVFPVLRGSAQIHDCLLDYLTQPGVTLPAAVEVAMKAGRVAKGLLAATIANRIEAMARNFIAGSDAQAALPVLRGLWDQEIAFTVDLLGEACVSREEACAYVERYLDLVQTLPDHVAHWPDQPRLESEPAGPLPRANVSIKISALDPHVDPIDFQGTLDRLSESLQPVLAAAQRRRVAITFDMEQYALKDLTLALFMRLCETHDFHAGIAFQAYLRSSEDDARRLIDWTRRSGRQVNVRLIKGAYWDYEVIHAQQMGWPVPVWRHKAQTDACFERLAEMFAAAIPRSPSEPGVRLAVGSHNVRSIARALAVVEERGLPDAALEVQMLYGMADALQEAVVARGLRLRQYVPVGPMIPGMAYLVRRLLENASNQSWLRAGFAHHAPAEELLADPATIGRPPEEPAPPAAAGIFRNEPWRDFSQDPQRTRFAAARTQLAVPHVAHDATPAAAEAAVARAVSAFPRWRDTPSAQRCVALIRAAALLRDRRDALAGVVIRESGKPWREADADVCEAIDFLEFYARAAEELFAPRRLGDFLAECNQLTYLPWGVAVVISPWNFPLAILTGMTVAALATGNAAIVKPAEQTPGIARLLCEALWQAGVPADVLQCLPGRGEVVGAALVRDPRVALIAFTGSKQVGLEILAAAGRTPAGQGFVKHVICEMGGKNAIVVDASADLDEAVLGVRQSAFGYAGQKCSACSRAIVLDSIYDTFLARLLASTRALRLGDPLDPATDVGPVIDAEAAEKIRAAIASAQGEARLELACEVPAGLAEKVGRPFIGPHVFSAVQPQHRLAQEEVFGPVLAVMRAATFDQALELANASDYKLTGGVYSRRPAHLEAARRRFLVGNLYLNRGITGALVARQPFGGFGLSGTGTKAGGREYLLQFVQPRCITENTLRHGFAPGLDE